MAKILTINPIYNNYLKMWRENRWAFSGELIRLTIDQTKGNLDNIEQHKLDMMNQIVDEHDGKWTEGYEYIEGILTKN